MKLIKKIIYKLVATFASPEYYGKFIGVKFGKNCYISTKGFSSEGFLITIGDNVRIAKEVLLLTHGGVWPLRFIYPELKDFDYYGKINIGNNVYIGQRAIIMPGVTIGNNCVIGASTIVNKSIPDNSVVGGNPVKYISTTDEFVERVLKNDIKAHKLKGKEKMDFIRSLPENKFVRKSFISTKINK
jgi:acetyltransferase-like isoleucine patch superfamily enzyme